MLTLLCFVLTLPMVDELTIELELKKPSGESWYPAVVVEFRNPTDKPIQLLPIDSVPGFSQLSIELVEVTTKERILLQRNDPAKIILPSSLEKWQPLEVLPGESSFMEFDLLQYEAGHRSRVWKNLPAPNDGKTYELTLRFETKPSPETKKHKLWIGKVQSKPVKVQFIDPKLNSAKEYMKNGYINKAWELMKKDPIWIEDSTLLGQAVESRDVKLVKWMLDQGADINAGFIQTENSVLSCAESFEMFELLLQHKPKDDLTEVLHRVIESQVLRNKTQTPESKSIIELLRKHGARYGFQAALMLNDLQHVKAILQKQPELADYLPTSSVPRKNDPGISPLRIAAKQGYVELCEYLIKNHQVDVNDWERGSGYPILREALAYPKIVKLLLDAKADIQTKITWRGARSGFWIIGDEANILHHAAWLAPVESFRLLLKAGCDPLALALDPSVISDNEKPIQSVLEVVAYYGMVEHAKLLLDHPKWKGQDKTKRQEQLDHCLNISSSNSLELVKLLLEQGANPNKKFNEGSAVESAVQSIHPPLYRPENQKILQMVDLLRKHGAKLNVFEAVAIGDLDETKRLLKDNPKAVSDARADGYPAIHFAASMNQPKFVEALLNAGCDIHLPNQAEHTGDKGDTPLHSATFWRNYEVVELLLQKGADPTKLNSRNEAPFSDTRRWSRNDLNKMRKLYDKYKKAK